jgi:hypothetical protein
MKKTGTPGWLAHAVSNDGSTYIPSKYPLSSLTNDFSLRVGGRDVLCFKKKIIASRALYWDIIFHVMTTNRFKQWVTLVFGSDKVKNVIINRHFEEDVLATMERLPNGSVIIMSGTDTRAYSLP